MSNNNPQPITGGMGVSMGGISLGGAKADQTKLGAFQLSITIVNNDKIALKFVDVGVNPVPGLYAFPLEDAIKIRDALTKAINQLQSTTTIDVKN